MERISIRIKRFPGCEDIPLPRYMTANAAGMDICAAVNSTVVLDPGKRVLVPTGIAIAMPAGVEAQIRPRSGLAIKYGIGLLNSPGTIDPDYRGEIRIIVMNFGDGPFYINRGDRIAQMVISRALHADLKISDELPGSVRDDGGFGHTGI